MTSEFSGFDNLIVWNESRNLSKQIYECSRNWNDLGLKDQIRRAVVSISSNIAEGYERSSRDDFVRFLYIAKGSAGEVRSQLYIALDLGFLEEKVFYELHDRADHIVKMLVKLIVSLKNSGKR